MVNHGVRQSWYKANKSFHPAAATPGVTTVLNKLITFCEDTVLLPLRAERI
jgi:hypothetical protein